MKTMYQCEFCGAAYEMWDDASKCEDSHKEFTDVLNGELRSKFRYAKGSPIPENCFMTVDIGEYDAEKQERKHEYVIGEYKLVKKLTPVEAAAIVAEYDRKQEESRLWWENYKKEQERRKAAEAEMAEKEGSNA